MNGKAAKLLAVVAGLMGAAGVALAAVAAHKVQSTAISTAAQMLMVHAAAVLALVAVSARARRARLWIVAASVIAAGNILFALALVLPPLAGVTLFPMAAPAGGSAVILGWILAAVAAAMGGGNQGS